LHIYIFFLQASRYILKLYCLKPYILNSETLYKHLKTFLLEYLELMSRRAHAGGKREAPERLAIGLSHQSTTALRSTNYCNIVFPRAEGSGSKGRFWIQGVPFSPAAYKFCPTVSSPAPSILGLSASRFPLLPEASSRLRSQPTSSLFPTKFRSRHNDSYPWPHMFFFSVPVVLSILVRAGFAVRCSFMSWWTRCFLMFSVGTTCFG
jgi:hypothetical protein